jgi:hypothetical protein
VLPDRGIAVHRLVARELGLEDALVAGKTGKLMAKVAHA